MKETQLIMGMPITIEIVDPEETQDLFTLAFDYFRHVDREFSVYKVTSEISRINQGEIQEEDYSAEMKEVMRLSEETKRETDGYFDIRTPSGALDTSGLVKGWAIYNAAKLLQERGCQNFCIEAGGDIQVSGKNADGEVWSVGIRHPFIQDEKVIVKVVYLDNIGIATSGTYIRGQHVYNPHGKGAILTEIASLTVIGPNVYEADRFATATFAMGREGVRFIENLEGFEAYGIDSEGIATMTTGFENYTKKPDPKK